MDAAKRISRHLPRSIRWIVLQAARRWLRFRFRLPLLRDYVVYLAVRLIICVIQSLPASACRRLSSFLAHVCCDRLRVRHRVVEENLVHAFPNSTNRERRDIEFRMWEHLFLMICELAIARRKIHETNWRDYIEIENEKSLVAAFLDSEPLVVVTAHFGNFELSGYLCGLLGFPVYTIARPLDNQYLHKFLADFRGATGQFVLPTKGSGEDAQRVLENGETLALLGDHYGGRKGCWVEFFGRPASCHKAISVFALANKSPTSVLVMQRVGDFLRFNMRHLAQYFPAQDNSLGTIPEMTRWYNQTIESAIRQAPEQYWWLHRRWKDPRKKKSAAPPTISMPSDRQPTSYRDSA